MFGIFRKYISLLPEFEDEQKKVFGLMVIDENDHLVGMLSMYDILLFIQPKHVRIWGEMEDIDPSQLYDERLEKVKSILVGDIMTSEVITITPETHLMVIADIMIKNHIRRLPVVNDQEVVGIVFVSDVFHINSVLITDENRDPAGVVSKTDVMSAFYAGFPTATPVENIMVGPPLSCYPDDELESSLDTMQQNGVHRLYVRGPDSDDVVGVLAYPDIVGLLYRYCRACDRGLLKARRRKEDNQFRRLKVNDVMTATVTAYLEEDDLAQVIEGLTAHRFGAVLIRNELGNAVKRCAAPFRACR